MVSSKITLVECPRDAIQGITHFLPTAAKARYLNQLLLAGFDRLDFGSFVSPKAVPQLADTSQLMDLLDLSTSATKLVAIVGNERGAKQAADYKEIAFIGFPFSLSETFQQRNVGATIAETVTRVQRIQDLCIGKDKKLLVYLSMAFGNPYHDPWQPNLVFKWVSELAQMGVQHFSLADTTGLAGPEAISELFGGLIPSYPRVEFGAHFHTEPAHWRVNVSAAFDAGCRQFDSAILGYGGCPMASNVLVGNLATDKLLMFMKEKGLVSPISESMIIDLEKAFKQLIMS